MKKTFLAYRYELIAALSGGVVMMLELVGARLMAPYFGTSIYVWTAMIGVILGALSLGYWYGGKLADKVASDLGLMMILLGGGVSIAFGMLIQDGVLPLIAGIQFDIRAQALLAALILFAPASIILGIVSPYVVKLKLSSLANAGQSVGRLYAAGTLGSIAGTFLAGYWLIAVAGNFILGASLVLALFLISFLAEHRRWRLARIGGGIALFSFLLLSQQPTMGVIADIDSSYARYQVVESQTNDQASRYLLMDNAGYQSGVSVQQPDELIFRYTRAFQVVAETRTDTPRALIIGGGTYTFPRWVVTQQATKQVDVVEIDPELDKIAEDYFFYKPHPRLNIIHDDGRVYLNQAENRYDEIYVDAFSSLTPPYHLTTVEAAQEIRRILQPQGLVIVNVIASPSSSDPYFTAISRTYRQVFEDVRVYKVRESHDDNTRQNLLFVMGGRTAVEQMNASLRFPKIAAPHGGILLTDDYAPVEQLIEQSNR